MITERDVARQLFRADTSTWVGLAVTFWLKCDMVNKIRFEMAFPEVGSVCREWYETENENDFWQKYDIR